MRRVLVFLSLVCAVAPAFASSSRSNVPRATGVSIAVPQVERRSVPVGRAGSGFVWRASPPRLIGLASSESPVTLNFVQDKIRSELRLHARNGAAPARDRKDETVIDSATSADVAAILLALQSASDRASALIALCDKGCQNLSAEAIGTILKGMGIHSQAAALMKARLPWDRITGAELHQHILPKLESSGYYSTYTKVDAPRTIAVEKWIAAQKPR